MANLWHDVSPDRLRPDDFIAVIEIEKGSKSKYELDKSTGAIASSTPPPTTLPTTASSHAPTPMTTTHWTCWCCAVSRFCL